MSIQMSVEVSAIKGWEVLSSLHVILFTLRLSQIITLY